MDSYRRVWKWKHIHKIHLPHSRKLQDTDS